MAKTLVFETGFEHGLAVPTTSGGGLYDYLAGTPAISGSVKRTGDYAIGFTATADAHYVGKNLDTASATLVGRLYIDIASLPSADGSCAIVHIPTTDGTPYVQFNIIRDAGVSYWAANLSGTGQAGTQITAGTWYYIDFKIYCGAATHTLDWKIDGVAQTSISVGGSATTTYNAWYIGCIEAVTATMYIDDMVLSATSGDYPIGPGGVVGIRPDTDGAHNNAANIMEDSSGNDIDGVTYFAFNKLNEKPFGTSASTGYVRQTANGTGNYCAVNFADISVDDIQGVRAILQYASATTSSNEGGCIIIDSEGTKTTLYGGEEPNQADYSETSAFHKSVQVTKPTAGWSAGAVNSLYSRFGFSGDASPDPYWLAMCLEVAYGTDWKPKVIFI